MSSRFRGQNAVMVIGYAQSNATRAESRSLGAVTLDVCRAAIDDAGLSRSSIDGFVTGGLLAASGDHVIQDGVSTVSAEWVARRLGIDPRFVAGFQGGGQLPGAVMLAVNAIIAGGADYVLVHRALYMPSTSYNATKLLEVSGDAQWTAPSGVWGAVQSLAFVYREYLERYGANPEHLASVLVEARGNGSKLPWSYWHGRPLTVAEYLDSEMIADPVRKLDCDIPVSACAAFVFGRADRVSECPHRPVYVAGYSQGVMGSRARRNPPALADLEDACASMARKLWSHSGLSSSDVDLPQLYDGFSFLVYLYLEAFGFCPRGEASRFSASGGISKDGGLPVLSGGGLLGTGRMHGLAQMIEVYTQLSRRAGDRQLEAAVGLACHGSPTAGGAVLYSAERL